MPKLIWIPESVVEAMLKDASRWHDLETGGSFMGYWSDANVAVITKMIDGGSEAIRTRSSFSPDREWEQSEIDRHYRASGCVDTYIGDWHTHPNAQSGEPSWTDRRCLKTIIRSPEARAPRPVMILLCGGPENWLPHAWVGQLKRRAFLFEGVETTAATISTYKT